MSVNPADSQVFGTLYGSDAMRAVFDDRALFAAMLAVEAALARVQARLGLIPAAAAEAISAAARVEIIDPAELAASVAIAGTPVVGVVRALSRAAGPEAGRWVHWGATTQDIVDSAVVLQIRQGLDLIRADLGGTIQALADQAERHRASVMAGRTFLQHALPISFGLKCAVWLQPLIGHLERLDQLRPRIERVQFGGAAGTLASLGSDGIAVLEGLAAELDLAAPAAPWHVARDGMAEAVSFLGLLCGSLGKIATDVALMAQTDVGELAEPYEAGRGGSSTMPHKRNPISAVYIQAQVRGVQALVPLMQGAMLQDHERATGPWQAETLALPQAFTLAHGALRQARGLATGMVADTARMRRNLDATGGLLMAEAVMMGLAPTLGRTEAHHAVTEACNLALAEHMTLEVALARMPAISAQLDEAAIAKLVDPAGYLGVSGAFIDRVLAQVRALG